jgi:hypothetical protein
MEFHGIDSPFNLLTVNTSARYQFFSPVFWKPLHFRSLRTLETVRRRRMYCATEQNVSTIAPASRDLTRHQIFLSNDSFTDIFSIIHISDGVTVLTERPGHWVALLLRVLEVLSSGLRPETLQCDSIRQWIGLRRIRQEFVSDVLWFLIGDCYL